MFHRYAADAVVNLGDCVAGPHWPGETWELLIARGIPTVRGNHDRYLRSRPAERLAATDRFALGALSESQMQALFDLPATIDMGDGILAVHGTPTDDGTYLTEEKVTGRMAPAPRETVVQRLGAAMDRAVVLCGHSHRQSVTQVPDGPLILNPGTVGCPAFADDPTAGGLEFRSPHARYAILTRRGGRWGAELFALAYDWDHAAAKARENDFPRWGEALSRGSVR